uniref:Uncharacterized protein n=3 Tax=Ditylenchus dipsaci TaxID=166011 RepID=A0A915E6R6_9BILA
MTRSKHSVNRPPFYPLRFTPDGTKLIGISLHLQDVFIFNYSGVQSVMNHDISSDTLFSALFGSRSNVVFWHQSNQSERLSFGPLSRDCCLVTADSKHLIVSASVVVSESSSRISGGIQKNSESLSPSSSSLEEITFYSIDLQKCVYLMERTLAVLSTQHQTIHMYSIDRSSGMFIPLSQIGRSMLDDDRLYTFSGENPVTEIWLTGFRQRFLTFLFKEHCAKGQAQLFLRNISLYRSLKMHKLQMVGPELLLLRMDAHASRSEPYSFQYMFVVLEWRKGTIVGVYSRSSEVLFKAFERYNESFRSGNAAFNHFPTSMEHCGYVRSSHEYIKQSTLASYCAADTRRRFLSALPFAGIRMTRLWVILRREGSTGSVLEDIQQKTNRLHVDLEFQSSESYSRQNQYFKIIFHPTEPFAISVNKSQPDALTTFHLPNASPVDV